ncbi:hypothetical protein ACFQZS_09530 [Mucilaginibacter calamicampi]|uniref:Uncharacterized protein n=1 Tax=Mucilaginibacter calamicampi TaxID=1302352 RepID=A0ABW2YWA9_9SPHI
MIRHTLLIVLVLFSIPAFCQNVNFASLSDDLKHSVVLQDKTLSVYDNSTGTRLKRFDLSQSQGTFSKDVSAYITNDKNKIVVSDRLYAEIFDLKAKTNVLLKVGMGEEENFICFRKFEKLQVSNLYNGNLELTVTNVGEDYPAEKFRINVNNNPTGSYFAMGEVFGALSTKYIALYLYGPVKNRLVIISRAEKKTIAETAVMAGIALRRDWQLLFSPKQDFLVMTNSSGIFYYNWESKETRHIKAELVTADIVSVTPDGYVLVKEHMGKRSYKYIALHDSSDLRTEWLKQSAFVKLSDDFNKIVYKLTDWNPRYCYIDFKIGDDTMTIVVDTSTGLLYTVNKDGTQEIIKGTDNKPFKSDNTSANMQADVLLRYGKKTHRIKFSDISDKIVSQYLYTKGYATYEYKTGSTFYNTKNRSFKEGEYDSVVNIVFVKDKIYSIVVRDEIDGKVYSIFDIGTNSNLYQFALL